MTLTFTFQRQTKNYSVYTEKGGLNKLYLPIGWDVPEVVINVEVAPKSNGNPQIHIGA